jgi:hypothetical protein
MHKIGSQSQIISLWLKQIILPKFKKAKNKK